MRFRSVVTVAVLALAACVPPPEPPPPAPVPVATPSPIPVALPTPTPAPPFVGNWMDAPATPGDWRYGSWELGTAAEFVRSPDAALVFSIRCRPSTGTLSMWRVEPGPQLAQLGQRITIRAETQERSFDALTGFAGGEVHQTLGRTDPLWDAIAFSKGRFAVEVPGAATLFLPAYPEITRVIEDCR